MLTSDAGHVLIDPAYDAIVFNMVATPWAQV